MDSAMAYLMQQRYDRAAEAVSGILREDPADIEAMYLLLTVRQTELMDYESYPVDGMRFISLADSLREFFEDTLPHLKKADSLRVLFYIGNIYGGISLVYAKTGNWVRAVSNALKSVSLLKDVIESDSTFYEAYLGVGVFHYYLSQNLRWVLFLGDKSLEGIEEIRKATLAPFPYDYAAYNSLAWIFIDRGELWRADSVVDLVMGEFPDNTIFLRIKARVALWNFNGPKAIEAAGRLRDISSRRNPVNWSDLLSACQIIVESYDRMGNGDGCLKAARQALNYDVPEEIKKISYVQKHLKYINDTVKRYEKAGAGP